MSRREALARLATRTHLDRAYRLRPWWNGVMILNYHRLGTPTDSILDRNVFSGTPEQFDRHLQLVRQVADLADPADLPALLAADAPKGRHVVITFDDGYRDNHDLALPVLQRHGAKAAFFIATSYIDRPRLTWYDEIAWILHTSRRERMTMPPWHREPLSLAPEDLDTTRGRIASVYPTLHEDPERTRAYLNALALHAETGRAPVSAADDLWMTWDHIRTLRDAGMTIGGHTHTHPALAELTAAGQEWEIATNRDRIVTETGIQPTLFAYPFGGRHQFTAESGRILARHGYRLGLSFYGGINHRGHEEPWDVRRLYMAADTTEDGLAALLSLPQLFGMAPRARRTA